MPSTGELGGKALESRGNWPVLWNTKAYEQVQVFYFVNQPLTHFSTVGSGLESK